MLCVYYLKNIIRTLTSKALCHIEVSQGEPTVCIQSISFECISRGGGGGGEGEV